MEPLDHIYMDIASYVIVIVETAGNPDSYCFVQKLNTIESLLSGQCGS